MVVLSILMGKIFGTLFGIIFFLSMFLSPIVTNFGNNLYHCLFSVFLPVIFAYMLFLCERRAVILSILYFASVFLRCLISYEYLTSIVLLSLVPFIVGLCVRFRGDSSDFVESCTIAKGKSLAKYAFILCVLSVLGFLCALMIHANIRGGGDLMLGLSSIYQNDFLRRMVGGNANDFSEEWTKLAINASVFKVLWLYFGNLIGALAFVSVYYLCRYFSGYERKLLCAMLGSFLLVACSWYIFGKAHSFVHTHINFIVLFFGFVAVIFYIPFLVIQRKITQGKITEDRR